MQTSTEHAFFQRPMSVTTIQNACLHFYRDKALMPAIGIGGFVRCFRMSRIKPANNKRFTPPPTLHALSITPHNFTIQSRQPLPRCLFYARTPAVLDSRSGTGFLLHSGVPNADCPYRSFVAQTFSLCQGPVYSFLRILSNRSVLRSKLRKSCSRKECYTISKSLYCINRTFVHRLTVYATRSHKLKVYATRGNPDSQSMLQGATN